MSYTVRGEGAPGEIYMDLYERSRNADNRHPWEIARFGYFSSMIMGLGPFGHPVEILDCGSGDGWFSDQLVRKADGGVRISCWDTCYSDDDIANLTRDSSGGITFTAERPDRRFAVLLLLDVLEHVEDDESFLLTLVDQNLESDGMILISVPAWPCLFGRHDVNLRHHRRYMPDHCEQLIRDSGLEIEREGSLFHSLLVPRTFQVLRERYCSRTTVEITSDWNHGAFLSWLVLTVLGFDNALSSFFSSFRIPIPGLSWWALCRKR